eukprot:gene4796-biopygen12805
MDMSSSENGLYEGHACSKKSLHHLVHFARTTDVHNSRHSSVIRPFKIHFACSKHHLDKLNVRLPTRIPESVGVRVGGVVRVGTCVQRGLGCTPNSCHKGVRRRDRAETEVADPAGSASSSIPVDLLVQWINQKMYPIFGDNLC